MVIISVMSLLNCWLRLIYQCLNTWLSVTFL